MEIPHHILDLIEKYLSSTISKDELRTLNEWYHAFDDSQAEMDIEKLHSSLQENLQPEEQISKAIYNRLMNRKEIKPPLKRMRLWRNFAAAIILLILLSGAGYFYFHKQPSPRQTIATVHPPSSKGDLSPGGKRARLTLADGSTIILDSSQNGTIGQQGGTNIQKLTSGQVSYNGTRPNALIKVLYNDITTPRGGTYQITLADGTRVWLNAATDLRFPTSFPGQNREVTLKGEAYFEVAKNADQPFLVHTDKQTIRVLGTHFNINAYPDESVSRTTLIEGSVKVTSSRSPNKGTVLSPGQQATLQPSGRISVNLHPDIEQVTGWKEGLFVFHSTDFKTILRLISRWYDADIVYNGKNNPVFTGQLSKQLPVSKVFALLSMTNEIHYTIEGNKILVSSK